MQDLRLENTLGPQQRDSFFIKEKSLGQGLPRQDVPVLHSTCSVSQSNAAALTRAS